MPTLVASRASPTPSSAPRTAPAPESSAASVKKTRPICARFEATCCSVPHLEDALRQGHRERVEDDVEASDQGEQAQTSGCPVGTPAPPPGKGPRHGGASGDPDDIRRTDGACSSSAGRRLPAQLRWIGRPRNTSSSRAKSTRHAPRAAPRPGGSPSTTSKARATGSRIDVIGVHMARTTSSPASSPGSEGMLDAPDAVADAVAVLLGECEHEPTAPLLRGPQSRPSSIAEEPEGGRGAASSRGANWRTRLHGRPRRRLHDRLVRA